MLETLCRNQSQTCVSDLRFDQWHAGELDAVAIDAIERHLADCDVCRARHSELEAQAGAFLTQLPSLEPVRPGTVASTRAGRSRPWRSMAALAAVATAIAVAMITRLPDPGLQQHDGNTRSKGSGVRFGFHVKQHGRVSLGSDGEEVHPGDQLRFFVSAPTPGHLAILSRDGAGVVSEYYPGDGQSRAVGKAPRIDLDSSVELDATLGHEVLWAVFCTERFSTDALRRQLQETSRIAAPAGCATEHLTIEKKARL